MHYKIKDSFNVNVGFVITANQIFAAVERTNKILDGLPATLFKIIDYKTTSAIIGAIYCDALANITDGAINNPIEKGHPDIIPVSGQNASEEELRKFPQGLEVKCTAGNSEKGAKLHTGQTRVSKLAGITWQAHHREVKELLGLVWDFFDKGHSFNYPVITGVFYSDDLQKNDWGKISGVKGRSTKVTGMRKSGREKMGNGWIVYINEEEFVEKYEKLLSFVTSD